MAHKTLIGGTAYDVKGGRDLIGGTGYAKKNGKALINGTAYSIKFGESLTWTIKKESATVRDSLDVYVNFTANGESCTRIVVSYPYMRYDTSGGWSMYVYNNGSWIDANTTITFDEPPTGALLTWLQAHATPQD